MSDAVTLRLGERIGRQPAHGIVAEAARAADRTGVGLRTILAVDSRVTAHLDPVSLVQDSLDTGRSAAIARAFAAKAREAAVHLNSST